MSLKVFSNIKMMIKVFLVITIIEFIYYLIQYVINSGIESLHGRVTDELIYVPLYTNLTGIYNLDIVIHFVINFLRYMAW